MPARRSTAKHDVPNDKLENRSHHEDTKDTKNHKENPLVRGKENATGRKVELASGIEARDNHRLPVLLSIWPL
jgi:hypothetical protein